MANIKSSALPDGSWQSGEREGVPVITVKAATQLFCQASASSRIAGAYPTWFVGEDMACAFALRKPDEPVVAELGRDVVLVSLLDNKTMQRVLDSLRAGLQQALDAEKGLTDGSDDEARKVQRRARRRLIWEQKRMNKLLTAVRFATGVDATQEAQEDVLRHVFHDDGIKLREGFGTDDGQVSEAVQLGGVAYGGGKAEFNRISVAKYDYLLAVALQEVFPWADGYSGTGAPSTWHRDQLYPSDLCLFRPGHCLGPVQRLSEFEAVRKSIKAKKLKVDPIQMPNPDTYGTRIYLDPRPPQEDKQDSVQQEGGGAVQLSPTIEADAAACLSMDSPLCNNEVPVGDANYEAWNICPPPQKRR